MCKTMRSLRILLYTVLIASLLISNIFCICLNALNTNQLLNNRDSEDCLKTEVIKVHFFYEKGMYKDYYVSSRIVWYITSRYIKIVDPEMHEITIFDDNTKILYYIFTDKKVYMSANPEKEPSKKRSANSFIEKSKWWKTGLKAKFLNSDIEVWQNLIYLTGGWNVKSIVTYCYITYDYGNFNSLLNFSIAEEKLNSIKPNNQWESSFPPGISLWSASNYYDESLVLQFQVIDRTDKIEHIKATSSLFEIPKDYKKVEWKPDLFKH
jgi:hypothetical protein